MTLVIILLAFAILLLLLFLLFLFLSVNLKITVHNKNIAVRVGLFKVYDSVNKKKIAKKKEKEQKCEENYKNTKQVINLIRKILDDRNDDLLSILKYMSKTFKVRRLDLALEYGFSEAALTGIAGGAIWAAISGVCAYAGRYFDLKRFLNIAVKPDYNREVLEFKLCFESRVRLLHLAETVRYILRFKDTLKGGR